MKISRESVALIIICMADLATTIWFVSQHGAEEANPFMRYFLEMGIPVFILAKAFMCAGPLAMLEWARCRHQQFVTLALRTGIILYLGSYGMVVWRINESIDAPKLTEAQIQAIEYGASRPATGAAMDRQRAAIAAIKQDM